MAVDTETKPAEVKKEFDENKLPKQDLELFNFVKGRIDDLKAARKEEQYNIQIEKIWQDADQDYAPHRLKRGGRRATVEYDEEKGWRSAPTTVKLGSSQWQSDVSQPNVFIKIQTALSILVDQNPSGVFTPASKKYSSTTELMSQLYERSWEYAKSKQQLKKFVFNVAKYGFAIARTYPLRVVRKTRELTQYDPEDPSQNVYDEKEVVEFNDIFRENLNPWNVWIDDMTIPGHQFSMRDWTWRKVYAWDVAEEEFGKYANWKFVKPGGTTTDRIDNSKQNKQFKEKKLVEVYFYENRLKDLFMVVVNGVPVVIEPLPVSDASGVKKLSCWLALWTLRHDECPYGIGIYEAIRYDQALLDRVRNQSIDQLTLSIYKMFFYQGTQALKDTGDIVISPGLGKQVLDPKNIQFLEIKGPGKEAAEWIDRFKKDIEDSSGITETLQGIVEGTTAFEIAQAKESALKRLKTPLDNILDALNSEAYITISLIQLLYSIPETIKITDPELIDDYIQETEADPELYEREPNGEFNEDGVEQEDFYAKIYPEFPLNLDKDEKGNLVPTEESRFFRVKPRFLAWEGVISVKSQSILSPSKQVDKALDLEMYNILIPLLGQISQERQLLMMQGFPWTIDDSTHGKTAKNILKLYDKDPRDVMSTTWFSEQIPGIGGEVGQAGQQASQGQPEEPLFVPSGTTNAQEAPRLAESVQVPQQPQSLTQRISQRLTRPFR